MNKKSWLYNEVIEMIELGTKQVPLKIIKEHRKNVRSSIGKDAVYLRIPYWTNKKQTDKLRSWCVMWLKTKHQKSGILDSLQKKLIKDGFEIMMPRDMLTVKLERAARKSGKGIIRGSKIHLEMPFGLTLDEEQTLSRKIINNLLCQKYQPYFEKRVFQINNTTFKQDISTVKLRYNYSKWGSCSSNKNISLSARLLFAPEDVVDYVIVHELAHLLEMNHSNEYWNLVERVMPDYETKEQWLKANAWNCDY